MEYVDPETLNRFFYRNELVLKEPEGGKKGGDGEKVRLLRLPCRLHFMFLIISLFSHCFFVSFIFTADAFNTNLSLKLQAKLNA